MKFSCHLKKIRNEIYQEISISSIKISNPKQQIEMTKLTDKVAEGFHYILSSGDEKRPFNTFSELFSSPNPRSVVEEFWKNSKDPKAEEFKEKGLEAINEVEQLKSNTYYHLGWEEKYLFTAGYKFYYVQLHSKNRNFTFNKKTRDYVSIQFDEIRVLDDYPNGSFMEGNSLFNKKLYGDAGSILFKKIAGIVRSEFTDWKKIIFTFEAKKEDSESLRGEKIMEVLDLLSNTIDSYLGGKEIPSDTVKTINALHPRIRKQALEIIKNKIKEVYDKGSLLRETKYNAEDHKEDPVRAQEAFEKANEMVEALLNGKKVTQLQSRLIVPSSIFRIHSTSLNSFFSKNTMRQKLYTSIIEQMFGKVYVYQMGNNMFFSKSKLPKFEL